MIAGDVPADRIERRDERLDKVTVLDADDRDRPSFPARLVPGGGRALPDLVVAAGAYGLLAFLFLGLRLLIDPGSQFLGSGSDPKAFIWCFGWWPHAILNGQNPFVTHAIWAPSGVNLVWTASVPGLALLFSPVTLLAGPVVAYNLAGVLLPAFAAWTGFVLCRYLTHAFWPAFVGGYLFGFSSYMLGQEEGHPHVTGVFVIPLVALVAIRYVREELDGRGTAMRLGPLLGFEFLVSTEVTFTLALALATGLILGCALVPERRRRIAKLVFPLTAAYVFAAVLTAPFVYYAIRGFKSGTLDEPWLYVTDLLNFVVPTKLSLTSLGWAHSIYDRFPGNDAERGAYLGLPALLIVALSVRTRLRTPSGRFLLAAFVVAVVASLGPRLTIDGRQTVALPWSWVAHSPLFDSVLTERLALYVSLVTAVIVALWTAARPPGLGRWLLPALALVAVAPNPAAGVWATAYGVPTFFTDSAYRSCLDPDETILPLPGVSNNESLLWQAEAGYRFRIAAGGMVAAVVPSAFGADQNDFVTDEIPPQLSSSDAPMVQSFIEAHDVSTVVVEETMAPFWEPALDRIATPRKLGGVLVYEVSPTPPSCTP